MDKITLQMDVMAVRRAELSEWDKANDTLVLDDVVGQQDTGAGMATVTVLQEHGPGGGWPEITVEGTAPAVLGWLLNCGWDLDTALMTMFELEHDHRTNPIDGSRVPAGG